MCVSARRAKESNRLSWAVILKMADADRLWGASKIHGELLRLGVVVSERTASGLLRRHLCWLNYLVLGVFLLSVCGCASVLHTKVQGLPVLSAAASKVEVRSVIEEGGKGTGVVNLENEAYCVGIDAGNGSIVSLFDKGGIGEVIAEQRLADSFRLLLPLPDRRSN